MSRRVKNSNIKRDSRKTRRERGVIAAAPAGRRFHGFLLWACLTTLLLPLCGSSAISNANRATLGETFAIVEPDTLQEIRSATKTRDWRTWMKPPPQGYSAFITATLPDSKSDQSRLFDPTYAIPFDINDANGRMLFPKGTRVNAYDKMKVPFRYIVISAKPSHFRWLEEVAHPTPDDKVIVANGNVLKARREFKRAVYALDERFKERFGVTSVPSIIRQEGNQLRVEEFSVKD